MPLPCLFRNEGDENDSEKGLAAPRSFCGSNVPTEPVRRAHLATSGLARHGITDGRDPSDSNREQ